MFKAIDVKHYERRNQSWIGSSLQDPLDPTRLFQLLQWIEHATRTRAKRKLVDTPVNRLIWHYCATVYGQASPDVAPLLESMTLELEKIKERMELWPPHFVAIKRINASSAPRRIVEELSFLQRAAGQCQVIPLITAERWEDQVIAVFPYFHNQDFRVISRELMIAGGAAQDDRG